MYRDYTAEISEAKAKLHFEIREMPAASTMNAIETTIPKSEKR